ncbi:unnamed protein product, partial [Ascophyllum nodosum]
SSALQKWYDSVQHRRNSWRKCWHVEGGLRVYQVPASGTLVIQPLPSETVYTILTRRMHSSREGYTSSEGFTPASGGHNYRGDQTNSSYTFSVIWDTAVKLTVVRK